MLANPTESTLAIRLINRGGTNWFKYDKLNNSERKRIEKRFNKEVISKLETYTNTKVVKETNKTALD